MVTAIIMADVCVLFAIGLLHVYWAFGGKWGINAVIPQQDGRRAFTPGAGITLLIALLVFSAGILLLLRSNFVGNVEQSFVARIGVTVCAVVFAMRVIGDFRYFGIFKKKSATTFSTLDTYLYVPLCAILSLGFVLAIVYGG
ncbi:DUF3995 domain-containing protein [Paenibacillus spongiae]|uniref:DUF3995 domain-containing protein n=1 Tax=Paenibacillus spongiae TaxID=2909671 RepID=A0ABY5SAD2_9BACL|nr:DUF3995 domain-containing protein [Paenibacillus spongiae]UVI30901.1 DUF3995 domain-containing protein [Paenibacillus spongiae]